MLPEEYMLERLVSLKSRTYHSQAVFKPAGSIHDPSYTHYLAGLVLTLVCVLLDGIYSASFQNVDRFLVQLRIFHRKTIFWGAGELRMTAFLATNIASSETRRRSG